MYKYLFDFNNIFYVFLTIYVNINLKY